MSTWIKLHRTIWNWSYSNSPEHMAVWVYLLCEAVHKDCEYVINGQKVSLKPGQFPTGRKVISKETGVSESKVFRILKTLEIEHQIEQQKTNKYTIITITNWEQYQKGEQQDEQQMNNKRTTDEQQVNTNKNDNNDKNEKNDKKGSRASAPITKFNIQQSLTPEQYQELLNDPDCANGDRDLLKRCCIDMQDWSENNPGKKNWKAALRLWVRRERDRQQKIRPFRATAGGGMVITEDDFK